MKKLLITIVLWAALLLHAQEGKFVYAYIRSYPQTVEQGITAPIRWSKTDWLIAASAAGIGVSLYIFDDEINSFTSDNKTRFTSDLSLFAKQFGEGKYILPTIFATGIAGIALGSDKTTDTGLLALKSFVLANGTAQVLKFATQRKRPNSGKGKEFFNGSGFHKNRESFPSGHATVAWSVAPIIAAQYRESAWVPPLAYGLATLTSCSRVHDNKHWASDAFAGSLIGYFAAKLTLSTTPRLQLYPGTDANSISFRWEM